MTQLTGVNRNVHRRGAVTASVCTIKGQRLNFPGKTHSVPPLYSASICV